MRKQASKGQKANLRLRILRLAKQNPEVEKELIKRIEERKKNGTL